MKPNEARNKAYYELNKEYEVSENKN
jgi:hypothetical protein